MDRKTRQTRTLTAQFNTRRQESGPVISGYFAVFDSDYVMSPTCIERVARGAFAGAIGSDVRALIDHETRLVLGRTTAGTLSLREDDHGLYGEILINEHDSDAMNLYARVQRGDVSQCSFGFDIVEEDYHVSPDGQTCTWVIRDVILYEVSVCTFPAYEATGVEARARAAEDALAKSRRERRKNEIKERIKTICLKS